jgi:hypothetical protein
MLFSNNGHHSLSSEKKGIQRSPGIYRIDPGPLSAVPVLEQLAQKIRIPAKFCSHEITSDINIPVFSVSISGSQALEDGGGLGAHPDARVALVRAFTEAIQQRLVQRLRNLISKTSPVTHWKQPDWENDGERVGGAAVRSFDQIQSTHNHDIFATSCCCALKKRGYDAPSLLTDEQGTGNSCYWVIISCRLLNSI